MGDFLRQAEIIKKIYLIIFLLAVLSAQLFFISIFSDQVITFSKAYDIIMFKQEILPMDPVKAYGNIERSIVEDGSLTTDKSRYRIMVNLEEQKSTKELVVSPVAVFGGEAAYPNSRVLLEVSSDSFLSSALTDSNGRWFWANYSHPLGEGEHTIKTYNISPFEISGVKDIFVQEYSFLVKDDLINKETSIVNLDNLSHSHTDITDEDLLKNIIDDETDGIYFFDTILLNKKNYFKGDHLRLQISAQALSGGSSENKGTITYEIFEDDGLSGKKVSEFKDDVVIGESASFLKKIELKDKMLSGDFFLKTILDVAGRKYISINDFKVTSEEVVKAGGIIITREHITRILLNSAALVLLLLIMILLIIIYEYKRFMKQGDVGKDFMRKRGYLNR